MKHELDRMSTAELCRLEKTLYNHGFGHTQTISDICFASADGDYITDTEGKRYIDFNGTLNLPLGHNRTCAIEAIGQNIPLNAVSYSTNERLALCLKLKEIYPQYSAFQFYSAGTEANEGSIRYAIAITQKDGFASFRKSYHGRTRATVSLCNMKDYNGNRLPGYFRVAYPDSPRDTQKIIDQLDELIGMDYQRNCAGIFIEPVLGKQVVIPPEGFLTRLKKEICEKYGILLIADEYLTSIRTGSYSECISQGVEPDIMTIGKCLGNGIPFAVLMCHEKHVDKVYNVKGSTTFGGNPFACSTVIRTLDEISSEGLMTRATDVIEKVLREEMQAIARCKNVRAVRAKGALLGIEMQSKNTCIEVCKRCVSEGVLVSCIKNIIRVTPALNVKEETLRSGLRIICNQILACDSK